MPIYYFVAAALLVAVILEFVLLCREVQQTHAADNERKSERDV
jgi:hypothetical protein